MGANCFCFVCPRYPGKYYNSFGKYRVSILVPSCSRFFKYDAYTMALRRPPDVVLPS